MILLEKRHYDEVKDRVTNVYDKFVLWLLDREPCIGYGTINGRYNMLLLEEEAKSIIDKLVERGILDKEKIEILDEGVDVNELEGEDFVEYEQCKTCKYFAALLGIK